MRVSAHQGTPAVEWRPNQEARLTASFATAFSPRSDCPCWHHQHSQDRRTDPGRPPTHKHHRSQTRQPHPSTGRQPKHEAVLMCLETPHPTRRLTTSIPAHDVAQ